MVRSTRELSAVAPRVPDYLETEAGANAGFSERLEFEVLDEITIEAIDLLFALMIPWPTPVGEERLRGRA